MRRISMIFLLAPAVVVGWMSSALAEVVIRAPFVTVRVGQQPVPPPVIVPAAAPVRVVPLDALPLPPPLAPAPAVPVPGAVPSFPPAPTPVPVPAPSAVRAFTHQEFAAAFQPAPGNYEVFLVHPGSKCPVLVRFCLPPGCPKVCVHRRELVFDYGKHEVIIRFRICGRVTVDYH